MTPPPTLAIAWETGCDGARSPWPVAEALAPGAVSIHIDAGSSCWRELECATTSEFVFLFHEWEPAVRVGIHAFLAYPGCDFDSLAPAIEAAYQRICGTSRIPWARAEPAARRIWRKLRGDETCESDSVGAAVLDRRLAEA